MLDLHKFPCHLKLVGLGGEQISRILQLHSAHEESDAEDHTKVECHVIDKICSIDPCEEAKTVRALPILQGKTTLADPDLGTPGRIDILLITEDVIRAY